MAPLLVARVPSVVEGEASVGFARFDMLALSLDRDSASNFLKLRQLRTAVVCQEQCPSYRKVTRTSRNPPQ